MKDKTKKLLKELRKFELDLTEVEIGSDLDYQIQRLKTVLDDYENTGPQPIHGGGTGSK